MTEQKMFYAKKWISIDDELPEENEPVLWCKVPVEEPPYVLSMCDDEFIDIHNGEYFTHWMPLPAPPIN